MSRVDEIISRETSRFVCDKGSEGFANLFDLKRDFENIVRNRSHSG